MKDSLLTIRDIVVKTVVTHTVTYFFAEVAAFSLFDYPTLIAKTELGVSIRPLSDLMVDGRTRKL